ncbi:GOR [Symbiodinium sp. CCMP2592]|nr:GOR [Symbiodinium sp. CCMP2592]
MTYVLLPPPAVHLDSESRIYAPAHSCFTCGQHRWNLEFSTSRSSRIKSTLFLFARSRHVQLLHALPLEEGAWLVPNSSGLSRFSVARAAEEDARKILRICGAQSALRNCFTAARSFSERTTSPGSLTEGQEKTSSATLSLRFESGIFFHVHADTFDICANWAKTAADCGEPLAMPKQLWEVAPKAQAAAGATVAAAAGQAAPGVTSKGTPASQAAPEANPPPRGDELEDAPPDSAAHQKVRFDQKKAAYTFTTPDASKKHFQTTVHAAAKNAEAAGRIARVCFYKFEQGVSIEEVMQYRNEAYKRLGGAPKVPASNGTTAVEKPPPPPRKRPKSTDAEEAVIERLQQQGKLLHALEISGRDSNKKNSTVNGVYMAVEGGYKGHHAYERISKKGEEARRCLFYSKEKSRWKISEGLGDHKNFAFLKVKDGGTKPPSAAGSKTHWHFFDGKDVGWTEDRDVKCVPYEQGKRAKTENGDAPEIADEASASSDSASSSSGGESSEEASDDDSASSGGSRSSGERAGLKPASTAVPATGPGRGPTTTTTTGPNMAPRPRTRACAKMLVRAGLRCSCHFKYVQECPSRKAAA